MSKAALLHAANLEGPRLEGGIDLHRDLKTFLDRRDGTFNTLEVTGA